MSTFLVSMDPAVHNHNTAQLAITNAGAKIVKEYQFSLTFKITCTKTVLNKIPGVLSAENASKSANFTAQALTTDHLMYTVDPMGQTAYNPAHNGNGQTVYLVDTGINQDHIEFSFAMINNLYTNFNNDFSDSAGHGTAVASLIVGENVGTAKNAVLHNVKLFQNHSGQITVGEVIDSLDAVLEHHNNNTPNQVKIVCLPWTIDKNDFVDSMIATLDTSGLLVVAAAGNDGTDVDSVSPAGVNQIMTVGAFDRNLNVTAFTNMPYSQSAGVVNYGAQVDIFTLGVDVSVAKYDEVTQYITSSGTSMAAGIAAGVATHYTERYPTKTADQIKDIMMSEGHYNGVTHLVFDNVNANVDYSTVYKSILITNNVASPELTTLPSGRICAVKIGGATSVNLGINPNASDVKILDFAPAPNWINVNLATGDVAVDTSTLDPSMVPGTFLFALRGEVNGDVLVEEFSVGVYQTDESELDSSSLTSYYYDADLDEYDAIVNYQTSSVKP